MKKKLNKKGFELVGNETVIAIVSVICFIFILYGMYLVYNTLNDSQNLKKAQASIGKIRDDVLLTSMNEKGEYEEIIFPPANWYMVSYVDRSPRLIVECDKKKSCICICYDQECKDNYYRACVGFNGIAKFNEDFTLKGLENLKFRRESENISIMREVNN